jgi:hypothetical protein
MLILAGSKYFTTGCLGVAACACGHTGGTERESSALRSRRALLSEMERRSEFGTTSGHTRCGQRLCRVSMVAVAELVAVTARDLAMTVSYCDCEVFCEMADETGYGWFK